MGNLPTKITHRNKKGPLKLIGIIFLVLIVLMFGFPTFMYFKSKAQCGDGGLLTGSLNEGYICTYVVVNKDFEDNSQCPDSAEFCKAKRKTLKEGNYCGPGQQDLTNQFKQDANGQIYFEKGPTICYYCCSEK